MAHAHQAGDVKPALCTVGREPSASHALAKGPGGNPGGLGPFLSSMPYRGRGEHASSKSPNRGTHIPCIYSDNRLEFAFFSQPHRAHRSHSALSLARSLLGLVVILR
eukprot:4369142-Prymnesium_polylepis.2